MGKINMSTFGCYMIAIAFVFWVVETVYFGCNAFPKSSTEAMCDALSALLFFAGFLIIKNKK